MLLLHLQVLQKYICVGQYYFCMATKTTTGTSKDDILKMFGTCETFGRVLELLEGSILTRTRLKEEEYRLLSARKDYLILEQIVYDTSVNTIRTIGPVLHPIHSEYVYAFKKQSVHESPPCPNS